MQINFNDKVNTVVTGNNEVYLGNAQKHVHYYGSQPPTPQHPAVHHTQQADNTQEAEVVPDIKIPSFFRTDAQSITMIQAKWQEALGNTTKTGVIRFVKSHDHSTGYFKFGTLTYEQLAVAFNEAQDKFTFTANDFENANKPLKK